MTGDPPRVGDHPDAKPVFDLDALGLMRAVATL
jgi:5,10-methylenetetrahydrofolate reductase